MIASHRIFDLVRFIDFDFCSIRVAIEMVQESVLQVSSTISTHIPEHDLTFNDLNAKVLSHV